MCVDADEQRTGSAVFAAMVTDAPLIAKIYASLNELLKADPRCPDVPNATRCDGMIGGLGKQIRCDELWHIDLH